MSNQQLFWHNLQQKYEDDNKVLKQKQLDLRSKLEAIDAVMGDGPKIITQEFRSSAPATAENVEVAPNPQFNSCTCSDRNGFFSNFFSIFKGKAGPAAQEMPTKEDRQSYKAANVTADDVAQTSCDAKGTDSCSCTFCPSATKMYKGDSFCNCSTCSRETGRKNEPCCCNYDIIDVPKKMGEAGARRLDADKPSTFSLKSIDVFYMKNIEDLATQHKQLQRDVQTLETQAKIYEDVLKDYKNINNNSYALRGLNETMPASDPDQKSNAELKLENFLLKNELKEMRLEVRQYIERMEGPMQYKIESERFKCLQLEQKLEETVKEHLNIQDLFEREINSLKMQLCTASRNVFDLTASNEQLQQTVESLKAKNAQIEDDLVRQKISEAETLKRMKAALEHAQKNASNVVKDECSLHNIARELSKILAECEPCEQCISLPEDLTEATRLLKSLTDMIDRKLPKGENDQAVPVSVRTVPVDNVDEIPNKQPETGSVRIAEDITSKRSKVSERASQRSGGEAPEAEEIASKRSKISERASQRSGGEAPEAATEEIASKRSKISERASQRSGGEAPEAAAEEIASKRSKVSERVSQGGGEAETVAEEVASKRSKVSEKVSPEGEGPEAATDEIASKRSKVSERASQRSGGIASVGIAETASKRSKVETEVGEVTFEPIQEKMSRDETRPEKVTDADESLCKCAKRKGGALEQKASVPDGEKAPRKGKSCKCGKKAQEVSEKPSEPKASDQKDKKLCKCKKKGAEPTAEAPTTDLVPVGRDDQVDQLWPKGSERFKLSHQVTATKSPEILKSQTSVKCLKVKENFPFAVDTQVDVLNKPPDGVHVTTTVTNSGTLEVITEGPEGVIETTLIYTNSGNVEVVTEILEYKNKRGNLCNIGKIRATSGAKAIEGPPLKATVSEPAKASDDVAGDAVTARPSEPLTKCPCNTCPGLAKPESVSPAVEEGGPGQIVLEIGQVSTQPDATDEAVQEISGIAGPESEPLTVVTEQHITGKQLSLSIHADTTSESAPGAPGPSIQDAPAPGAQDAPASDAQEAPAPEAPPAADASDTPNVGESDTSDTA